MHSNARRPSPYHPSFPSHRRLKPKPRSCRGLPLLVLLRNVLDLEVCSLLQCVSGPPPSSGILPRAERRGFHTRGQAGLELLGLVGVGEDEGVEVPLAADLELDLLAGLVLLDPGG